MANSTPARLAIGLLAIFPIAYFIFFAINMSSFPSAVTASPDAFDHLFRIHMISTAISMLLIVGFVVYLFRTTRVPQPKKALWAVVLLMAGVFGIPVFWWIYIRPSIWPRAPGAGLKVKSAIC